ncbi:hypothetical protein FDECE_10183 [Fusarium decemcellulare]|nr:hypothetical protein FDECE_10183 [Fusarium decemcellulare]
MAPPPELPSKLTTCLPPWCDASKNEGNSPETEPAPRPFCLTVPHSVRRNTHLWDVLGIIDELSDRALKDHIDPLCREIKEFQKNDKEQMYGLSKLLVIKYGETAMRVIRRVWDLHLAFNTAPEIPGDDPGVFGQSEWLSTIRDVVLHRVHYTEDFNVANHDQVRKGVYITDVLTQEHADRAKRAQKEREVLLAMHVELTQEDINDNLPAYKATALREAPLLSLRRCIKTVEEFHILVPDEDEDIPTVEEEDKFRMHQAYQLWHVAARAAMTWEIRRYETLQSILPVYCADILHCRRREKRERDSNLREQLEAILGDTRGDQLGMESEESEQEDSDDKKSEGGNNNDDDDPEVHKTNE